MYTLTVKCGLSHLKIVSQLIHGWNGTSLPHICLMTVFLCDLKYLNSQVMFHVMKKLGHSVACYLPLLRDDFVLCLVSFLLGLQHICEIYSSICKSFLFCRMLNSLLFFALYISSNFNGLYMQAFSCYVLNHFQLLSCFFKNVKQLLDKNCVLHTFLFTYLWVTGCSFHYLYRQGRMRRMMWGPWTLQWAQVHWQRALLLTLRSALQMPQMQWCVRCNCEFVLLLLLSL